MLSIYNTLTKKKEIFEPINPPEVRIYMCGPTVYDYFHIGNARSWVMSDVLRRYLLYKGYKVKFVMNITDVDDKIIKRSNEKNEDFSEFAEKYINAFFDDMEKIVNSWSAHIYILTSGGFIGSNISFFFVTVL